MYTSLSLSPLSPSPSLSVQLNVIYIYVYIYINIYIYDILILWIFLESDRYPGKMDGKPGRVSQTGEFWKIQTGSRVGSHWACCDKH